MSEENAKKLGQILRTGALAQLTDEAQRRRETTARVRDLLPPDEAAHLVAAHVNARGELVVAMDSAAWAARVRYREELLGERRLRVRVVPED
jgi:hypothetical protein